MKLSRLGLITVSVLLTACSTLPEGRWLETGPAVSTPPITLEIKNHRISASAGCNHFTGPVKMAGDQLVTGHLAGTLMMCHGEEARKEDALKQLLADQPTVHTSGDQLTLTTPEASYVFQKQPNMEDGVTRFIYIAPEKVDCTGVRPMECLQIRESADAPWTPFYGQIEGFEFQPGTAYRLRIKEFDVPKPPADASGKRWILDLIVEQDFSGNQ